MNLDMLKTRHRERCLIETCLQIGQPYVIDNTNPTCTERTSYIQKAKEASFKVVGYYFQSKVNDAISRNAQRPGIEQIPEQGIRGTHARLQLPSKHEGFDELFYVVMCSPCGFVVQEWQDEV